MGRASVRVPSPGPLRSIRSRIVTAFLAALVAMMGAQAFLIWQQQRVARSLTLISRGYLPLAKIVAFLERDFQRVENDVGRMLRDEPRPTFGGASSRALYTEQLHQNLEVGRIRATHAKRSLSLSTEEQAVFSRILIQLDRIETMFDDYEARSARLVRGPESGEGEDDVDRSGSIVEEGTRLGEEIETLGRLLDARIDRLSTATQEAQVRALAVAATLTVSAFIFVFGLIGAVLLALRPIGRLTAEVQRLAAGDYTGRVEIRGVDEIALLGAEFNGMVRALQIRDRTLVERAEQLNRLSRYLTSVLDALDVALFVVEAGRVTLANPAARRVWGVRRDEPPPRELPIPLDMEGRLVVDGPNHGRHEVRIRPFQTHGCLVVAADVTEQLRAQNRLARSERLALIGQMLAQITHEVRNPLNAMSLNAELLADELRILDPDLKSDAWEQLRIVSKEIDRLTAVTGHYLQLARRPPAELAAQDLGELIADVKRLLDVELSQDGAEVSMEPVLLAPQLLDGNQIRQALINVVRNAAEAGARHLHLTVERHGQEVHLVLEDDGPGMSEVEIERAFDPFYSTKTTGTGLGLAITRQILEDHDGTVRVRSVDGVGTTVTLVLPWRPASLGERDDGPDHPRGG